MDPDYFSRIDGCSLSPLPSKESLKKKKICLPLRSSLVAKIRFLWQHPAFYVESINRLMNDINDRPKKGAVFSKLGKISSGISYLAFPIILLFRRARFSMSLTREGDRFIYMIRIERSIAAKASGSGEAKVHGGNTVQATQGASCEEPEAQQALRDCGLGAKRGLMAGKRVRRPQEGLGKCLLTK